MAQDMRAILVFTVAWLGIAGICISFGSCSAGKQTEPTTTTLSEPGPPPSQAASTASSSPPTVGPRVVPVNNADISDIQRLEAKAVSVDLSVFAEDFRYGPLLKLNTDEQKKIGNALEVISAWVQAIKEGTDTEGLCTKEAAKLSDLNFGKKKALLAGMRFIRFLGQHRIEPGEADFDVVIVGATGRSQLGFYLTFDETSGKWLISDVQGDLSTLSQSTETEYTDYAPQDAERQLIREGHQIQWQ